MDVRDPIDSGHGWDDSDDSDDYDYDYDDEYIDDYERFQELENESFGETLERIESAEREKEMEKMEKKGMLAEDSRHIQIQDLCGLCSQDIIGDGIFALINHHESPQGTRPEYCSKMFFIPSRPKTIRETDRYPICNKPMCKACLTSPESVAVHKDCCRLFLQAYPGKPALEHLWVATAWRMPWTHTPGDQKVQLDLVDASFASVSASRAKAIGLPELESLPHVVLQLIKSYSSDHIFWRYSSIKAQAEELSTLDESTPNYDNTTCKLDTITSWHRGEKLEANENGPKSGVFRITVDRYGLLDIERLAEQPKYKNCKSSTILAYSFIGFDEAAHTKVHFKLRHARIELPTVVQKIYPFWDTPEPHVKDLDVLLKENRTVGAHLHTVDLRDITGVAFFYHKGELMAIHAHTATEPTAVSTAQRLWRVDYNNLLWFYLPLPAGDRILRCGVRSDMPVVRVLSLLITTKLSGNLYIGPDVFGDKCFSQKVPNMFIHDIPRKGGIGNLAIVGEEPPETLPEPRFPFRPVSPQHINMHLSINSMALGDSKHITVFNDASTGYFKGILLEYEDGSQKACGQCRMGVDPVKKYVRPAFICMREVAGTRRHIGIPDYELECNMGEHKHGHGRGSKGWKCSDARTMSITVSCDDEVSEPWIYFSEPGEEDEDGVDDDYWEHF